MKYVLISIILGIWVWVGWRLYSNWKELPCPAWLGWLIELDNPLAPVHKAEAIVRDLELVEGMKVLDVGCGPGRVLISGLLKTTLFSIFIGEFYPHVCLIYVPVKCASADQK